MQIGLFLIDELSDDEDDIEHLNANIIAVNELLVENPEINPQPVRNADYFEITVPRYSLDEFRALFRMSRATMEELVMAIGREGGRRREAIPLRKKVLIVLWILAKKETFLDVGDRFGLAPGSVYHVFKEIINILCRLRDTYIQWPFGRQRNTIVRQFERKSHGFPGIVGAIDCCHIQIKAPVQNAHDYYNRKQVHAINLQAVCEDKLRFTNIFVGMPGRVHDARFFRLSPLYRELTDNDPLLPPHLHIIGDAAYPLLPFIMTPFRNNGHLTAQKVNYNIKLSSIRSTIERAFGMLKGKLRRLKYLDMTNTQDIPDVIVAACVLHNFMLLQNEEEEWWRNEENEDSDSGDESGKDSDGNVNEEHDIRRVGDAHVKREYIVSVV